MKWSEVRRKAEEDGWVLVRFGRNHDLYEKNGKLLLMERHSSAEVSGKVYYRIRKQLDLK